RGLRRDDKCRVFVLKVRPGPEPRPDLVPADRDLTVVIGTDAARAVQPDDEREFLVLRCGLGNEQAIRHQTAACLEHPWREWRARQLRDRHNEGGYRHTQHDGIPVGIVYRRDVRWYPSCNGCRSSPEADVV